MELVCDRTTRDPAPGAAVRVLAEARARGLLLIKAVVRQRDPLADAAGHW
jgi:hypothetical protein